MIEASATESCSIRSCGLVKGKFVHMALVVEELVNKGG